MSDELREIDRQIAEAIGESWAWERVPIQDDGDAGWCVKCQTFRYFTETIPWRCRHCGTLFTDKQPLPFSTYPRAAWMLLEHIPEGWVTDFYHVAHIWRCRIQIPTDTYMAGIHPEKDNLIEGEGDNKKLALCRAFLKAVEK